MKNTFTFIKKYYSPREWGWGGDTRTRWTRGCDSISHPCWVCVG